jgi:hypothetical protein
VAEATVPPPAAAKRLSAALSVSSVLNAMTSAWTADCRRSAMALFSFAVLTVSWPSVSKTRLRSPVLPRPLTATTTASLSAVSPWDTKALTERCTTRRSLVGATSTPAVLAKDTVPTFTSAGAVRRNVATAARTVAMPSSCIEPLVSMTSMVLRCRVAGGWTWTG